MDKLKCGNCHETLHRVTLSGHYKRSVELDVCERCALIWFEGTETARLAGPGVIDLIRLVHAARPGEYVGPLSAALTCPRCNDALKEVRTLTRFGRTKQLHCPRGHGYLQTFVLYLAEKGFLRPLAWPDVKKLAGRTLFCAGCGAGIEARAQLACPYCQSNVGLLDPARLASAVDLEGAAADQPGLQLLPSMEQMHCRSCGASVDPSQHAMCPHCNAPLQRKDTERAVAAVSSVETSVRQNYERQLPRVSVAKMQAHRETGLAMETTREHLDRIWNATRRFPPWQFGALIGGAVMAAWIWAAIEIRGNQFIPAPKPAANAAPVRAAPAAQAAPKPAPIPVAASVPVADSGRNAAAPGQLTMEEMFSTPAMQCEGVARSAVRVSQIIVVPGAAQTAAGATLDEMRAAYGTLEKARHDIGQGASFAQARGRYNDPRGGGEKFEGRFLAKGELPRVLERAAFCLAKGEVSPVLRTQSGFHLLQVVELR